MTDEVGILYQLLKDYHEAAWHIKAIRADKESGGLEPEQLEHHRHAATGWFNAVYVLWMTKAISKSVLQAVASPRAAQLWLDYVAPLDKAVRDTAAKKYDRPAGMTENPVEKFWTYYAKKQIVSVAEPVEEGTVQ